jgi:hypothetical protein
VTVWFAGCVVIVGAIVVAVPVPDTERTDIGVRGSSLVMATLPVLVTDAVGEYVTLNELLALGAIELGVVRPETVNGLPLTEIEEMVRLEPPKLLIVTVPFAVVPTVTLPIFRLVAGVSSICCGAVVAVPARTTCSEVTPVSVWTAKVPVAFPTAVALNQT